MRLNKSIDYFQDLLKGYFLHDLPSQEQGGVIMLEHCGNFIG